MQKLQTSKYYQINQKEGPKMRERTRKALALLLAVCMVLSLVPAAYATPENGTWQVPFTEVEDAQVLELRESTVYKGLHSVGI